MINICMKYYFLLTQCSFIMKQCPFLRYASKNITAPQAKILAFFRTFLVLQVPACVMTYQKKSRLFLENLGDGVIRILMVWCIFFLDGWCQIQALSLPCQAYSGPCPRVKFSSGLSSQFDCFGIKRSGRILSIYQICFS